MGIRRRTVIASSPGVWVSPHTPIPALIPSYRSTITPIPSLSSFTGCLVFDFSRQAFCRFYLFPGEVGEIQLLGI